MKLSASEAEQFREVVWDHYKTHARALPWRDNPTPYNVVVSELMLQQTQVARVLPKYESFLYTCSSFAELSKLPLSRVLELWSGLGYNRRAKYLHEIARLVTNDLSGQLPATIEGLVMLPGIGKNTAGAIRAYAFNQPSLFIETNIRTVLFHHFFPHAKTVHDRDLLTIVEQVLDRENPREWYWALMDYGTYLKRTDGARLDQSAHYIKQPALKGSRREMRGRIIRGLLGAGFMSEQHLRERVEADERFIPALEGLMRDGLVVRRGNKLSLTESQDAS